MIKIQNVTSLRRAIKFLKTIALLTLCQLLTQKENIWGKNEPMPQNTQKSNFGEGNPSKLEKDKVFLNILELFPNIIFEVFPLFV